MTAQKNYKSNFVYIFFSVDRCQFVHEFAGILAVVPTESLVHPKQHHASITEHFDRLLNKKLIAVIEDKVKLFTEPERAA